MPYTATPSKAKTMFVIGVIFIIGAGVIFILSAHNDNQTSATVSPLMTTEAYLPPTNLTAVETLYNSYNRSIVRVTDSYTLWRAAGRGYIYYRPGDGGVFLSYVRDFNMETPGPHYDLGAMFHGTRIHLSNMDSMSIGTQDNYMLMDKFLSGKNYTFIATMDGCGLEVYNLLEITLYLNE